MIVAFIGGMAGCLPIGGRCPVSKVPGSIGVTVARFANDIAPD
jgi:hypothetical protein